MYKENQDLMASDSDEEEDNQGALMMLQRLYLWTESTVDNDKSGALSDMGDLIENVVLRLNKLRLQSKGEGGNSSAEVAVEAAKAEGAASAATENATGGVDSMQSTCDLPSTEAEALERMAEVLFSIPDENADAIIANMMILVGNKPYNQPD